MTYRNTSERRQARRVPRPAPLSIADPVPVGIAGFGMTTFILSCVNAGFFGGAAAAGKRNHDTRRTRAACLKAPP